MPRRRRDPRGPSTGPQRGDPFVVLGLAPTATEREIHDARRRLAKQAHPDAGGSVEQMQRVNDAAAAALRQRSPTFAPHQRSTQEPAHQQSTQHQQTGQHTNRPAGGAVRRDHPSFTVEALPAETFEALLVVASWLGDVIDDEPPYGLELALTEPMGGWCRLDLVPDAGASTVSITVAGAPGHPTPSVDAIRDTFIDGLNRLDWQSLDP